MFRNRRRPRIARIAVAGAAALLAVGIAACSSSSSTGGGTTTGNSPAASSTASANSSPSATAAAVAGGTATYALPAGVTVNYIFPFVPAASANEYNTLGFQEVMYRPLYYFGGENNSVTVNYPLSTADAPVYSNGDKTVTITMKGWKWSNGESVDASDLVFWLNMMEAQKSNYYGYVPGLIPDNLASYKATGPDTVVLNLKSAVSSIWFTYNQLAELTPMPQAWDVTAAGAKAGSGGCTTDTAADKWAKCNAVYTYLSGLAKSANGYATSPIWGVVDGPFKLSSFNTDGYVTLVPNKSYSGSPKPELDAVKLVPYTDDTTEYTGLKTSAVDVGYVPPSDLAHVSGSEILPPSSPVSGYSLSPYYSYGIQYYLINFHNPKTGPVFSQLYVRQALQESMDQEGMIKAIDNGYGYPTSGAVPEQPSNPWIPSVQSQNGGQGPYAFSTSAATTLLTSHGWSEVGGVQTCEKPGTASNECGANIAKGTKLSFTMDYATGIQAFQEEVANYKSDASRSGIQINLVPQSFDTIIGETTPCAVGPKCNWDMLNFGGWNFNGPGFEPTGEPLFATGAGSNAGSYSDSNEDKLISETHTSSSISTFDQYAAYTAQQLPYIWMPNAYAVQATSNKLGGVAFNPLGDFLPEYWYFTK
jgi:peptide/nickel transport system substrate-binding protein